MIVAADAANAAGDEVGVARIFALHEDAVAAKDRRGAVTLRHMLVLKVDLGKDAQAAHDTGDRVPVHFHQVPLLLGISFVGAVIVLIAIAPLFSVVRWLLSKILGGSRW